MDGTVDEYAGFLDRHLPAFRAEYTRPDDFATWRRWQAVLATERWVGLSWSHGDGGRGLDIRARLACEALAATRGAPELAGVLGVNNVGPTIAQWGTDAQRTHLPRILRGDEIWCQGFSEPDAGSDLASLTTRATPTDGGYRITGQKVWTSAATEADWCQLLAREGGQRHEGITCFALPLDRPGIEVRPLRQITGDAEFGQLFLDDVAVTDDDVLGAPREGWRVAMMTLRFERANTISLAASVAADIDALVAEARRQRPGSLARDAVARCVVEGRTLHALGLRSLAGAEAGAPPGPEHSILKLKWSLLRQEVARVRHDLRGPGGGAYDTASVTTGHAAAGTGVDDAAAWELLRSRASTIAGGTTEVLRNVLAERVLGLPR